MARSRRRCSLLFALRVPASKSGARVCAVVVWTRETDRVSRRARWCRVIVALIDIRSLLADRASEKEVVREKSGERGRRAGVTCDERRSRPKEERSGEAEEASSRRIRSAAVRRGTARRLSRGYAGRRDGARPRRGSNVAEWGPLIGSERAATGFDDHRRRRHGRHRRRGRADPPGDSR